MYNANLRRTLAAGTVLSSILLFPALATAQNNSGPGTKATESTPAEIGTGDRFAVVRANAIIARHFGAVSVVQTDGVGTYEVRFNKNVRNCMYTATIGLSGISGSSAPGFITVVGGNSAVQNVYLTTHDIDGVQANRGFHLLVACP
jgi:hypothetical protein